MKKSALGFLFAAFLSISALAQNVQEGVSHLYAQRYASAKSTFEKLLAANPNNIEATYWLGQTLIAQKNVSAARALYEKALQANGNAPLLMVGLGNVELVEGKQGEARSHFEAAINASKGKKANDPVVLSAVGRAVANAYSESNKTDLAYAISKLTEASQIAPNNPEVFLNLGNAYRKQNKGGEAVQAYRQALQINPKFAVAAYRTAQLYKTQVSYRQPDAWSVVLDNLNAAISADPRFAPAYEDLYYYNLIAKGDYNAAQNFASQFKSNADPSVENDYLVVQTYIVQKNWPQAIAAAKNIVSQTGGNPNPRVFRALAVSSMGNKDTTSACDYINQFFSKAADEDVLPSDYIIRAQACARNNPAMIRENIMMAVKEDSVLSRQIRTLNEAIEDAKANNQRVLEAELRMMSYQLRQEKGSPTNPTELISYMAVPFYLGGAYERADSISQEYAKLAPDSIYGYYWSALSKQAVDTGENMKGTFVPDFQKSLDIATTNPARYQTQGVKSAISLAIYYVNVKKDVAMGKSYIEQGLKFDPTNASLLNFQQILNNSSRPPTQQKTNNSSNQAKDTKVKTEPGKTKIKPKG